MWESMLQNFNQYGESLILDGVDRYTYNQFRERVENLSELFGTFVKHQKCVILCRRNINTALAIFMCFKNRCIPIPVTYNYGVARIQDIIKDLGTVCVISDDEVEPIMGAYPIFNIITGWKTLPVLEDDLFEDKLVQVSVILYTSGSTGCPKGVMLTKEALLNNLKGISGYFDITSNDTIFISRPICHSGVFTGELLYSISKGVNILFDDSVYSAVKVARVICNGLATVICGTPTLINHAAMLVAKKNIDQRNLKIVMSGEPLYLPVASRIREVFSQSIIYHVYGLTEAGPRVSFLPPNEFNDCPVSVGYPLCGVEIYIFDECGNRILEKDTCGCIYVKSNSLMSGYYNRPNDSAKVMVDNVLCTGDIGFLDDVGRLHVVGRQDDMMIKGGMNIYPAEVEDAILSLDEIEDVLVYSTRNLTDETVICADVVLAKNVFLTELACRKIFAGVLPAYKMPTEIKFVEAISKTASGKKIRPKIRYME